MKTSTQSPTEPKPRLWRHEIKYPVSEARARELYACFAPLLREDENAGGEGGYLVKSLYFDTPRFGDFADKELGAGLRQKARLRSYGEGGLYRLELKIKLDDMNIKRSCSLDEAAARALASGDLAAIKKARGEDAGYIHAYMSSRGYRPAAVIKYFRRAILSAEGGFRLTFDTEMTSSADPESLFCARCARDIPLGGAVVEVKYGDFLPSWVTDRLYRCGVTSGEFSKYSLGCAAALGYIL